MSKLSTLFTAGIFVVFMAILFHYFCRVKKKQPVIVQQQVQVPEGYVYPIASNMTSSNQMRGPNFSPMQPPFVMPQNVPYPYPYPSNIVIGSAAHQQHAHHNRPAPYPTVNATATRAGNPTPTPANGAIGEDLPPPYHVAVASSPYPPK